MLAYASRVFQLDLGAGDSAARCLAAGELVLDLMCGMAAPASITKGADLHSQFVVDRYLIDEATGERRDVEAKKNKALLKDYYAGPTITIHYLKALEPAGWELLLCDTIVLTEVLPLQSVGLEGSLAKVDEYKASSQLVFFILVGSGKAFSIVRTPFCVLSFDSHERSKDGTFKDGTCVGQLAAVASDLYGHLAGCYDPSLEMEVYAVQRVGLEDGGEVADDVLEAVPVEAAGDGAGLGGGDAAVVWVDDAALEE